MASAQTAVIFCGFMLFVVGIFLSAHYLAPRLCATVPETGWFSRALKSIEKDQNIFQLGRIVAKIVLVFTAILFAMFLLTKLWGSALRALAAYASFTSILIVVQILISSCVISRWLKITSQLIIAASLTLAWLVFPNWLTLDIAAFFMVVLALAVFKDISFKQALVVAIAIMIDDAFHVFGSEVMQAVASRALDTPLLFIIPKSFSLDGHLLRLGLGDVVLPGLVIMIALREARNRSELMLAITTIIGYFVGLVITVAILFITHFGQPATIYLYPCVFAGLLFAAWQKGLVKEICKFKNPS